MSAQVLPPSVVLRSSRVRQGLTFSAHDGTASSHPFDGEMKLAETTATR